MKSIRIDLHGFSETDVADFRSFLASNDAVADVYQVHGIQASNLQDVLSATLAETTLVAEVVKEVAGVIVSLSTIEQAIRSWVRDRTKEASQHAEITVADKE